MRKLSTLLLRRPVPILKKFFVLFCLFGGAETFAQVITPPNNILAPTSTTLSSTANPSIAGQPVIITATVTSPGLSGPTGTVDFYDNDANIDLTPGGIAMSNGIATYKTSALNVDINIKATYSGDAGNLPSTSSVFAQIVSHPEIIGNATFYTTTTALVSSTNPSLGSQPVTLTATVISSGDANLTGKVDFYDNTDNKDLSPGGIALLDGVATFTTSSLDFGNNLNITATYGGDANGNQLSTSNSLIQDVELNFSGLDVTVHSSSTGNTSNWGDLVTFNAVVSTGVGAPSGTVIFADNGYLLGSATMNGSGLAILQTNLLTPGSHNISASYLSITSPVLIQTVNTTLPNSINHFTVNEPNVGIISSVSDPGTDGFGHVRDAVYYGQPITFAVNVVGDGMSIPTGSISFMDMGVSANPAIKNPIYLGTAGLDATANATFTTSLLSVGVHYIYAVYSGNDYYGKDSSSMSENKNLDDFVVAIISKAYTGIGISSSLNPSVTGQQITFIATVPAPFPGDAIPPTGTVTFYIDGVHQNPVPLTGNGFKAFLDVSSLSPGSHIISATYLGDGNYGGSSSGGITQSVGAVGSSTLNFLGSSQSTLINTFFPNGLLFDIMDLNPNLAGGAAITFAAPSSGASGTFSNGTNTITVHTTALGSVGVADSGPFKANGIAGTYTVTATIPGYGTDDFTLTNTAPTVQITIGLSVTGLSFTVDGLPLTSAQTFNWVPGSSHSIATTALQAGPAGTQYVFTGWSDGTNTLSDNITVPSTATSYTANFSTQYQLTITANPSNGGTVSPASGAFYNAGDVVPLTATANTGYAFSSWTGNVASTGVASTSVTMNAPQNVSANFDQLSATVPVTVGTSVPGLSFSVDFTTYTTSQTFGWFPGDIHSIGTSVTQAGGAGTQYVLTSWTNGGGGFVTAPSTATTYTANFKTQYQLTTISSPASGSSGSITPASGNFYDAGTIIGVQAYPDAGSLFSGFTGDLTGTGNPQILGMNGPKTVTAGFAVDCQPVTWLFDGDNDGYYSGEYIGVGSCNSPGPGWKPASSFTKGVDCDDNDPSVTTGKVWYKDADNDGYSDGATKTQCDQPTGYKLAADLIATSGDCNDGDAMVHAPVQYYIDADKDGYGSTATAMLCSSTAPVGYSTNNTDYDDADPTMHTSPTTTTTGVTSSLNPSCAGSNVNFTATVTFNGNPVTTGSVAFVLDGNTTLAAAVLLDANGQATYSGNTLPAGSHTINVGYSGATGFATSSGTVNQTINTPATVSFSGLASSYCANAGAATLTGSILGGTFSGAGINGNTFDPAIAGVGGPYTIIYSYTDGNGCSANSSQQVTVNAVATATISGSTAVCIGAPSPNITFTGSGGTAPYTFTYTLSDIPPQTVTTSTGSSVTVAVPTNNAGTLSYNLVSVQDASSTQCSQTVSGQTATVIVNGSPAGSISGSTSVCKNGSSPFITFSGSGGIAPYTFTYTLFDGTTTTSYNITGNPAKVAVLTGTAGNFTYTLISVQDASSTQCSQVANGQAATVTVNNLPDATIATESLVTAASTGNIASVPDAGSGALYNWSISNGTINAGVGTRSITYKAGNSGSVTINVSVKSGSSCGPINSSTVVPTTPLPCPNPAITVASSVCSASAGNIASVTSAGTGATYVWTITNGTITGGSGTHQITFTSATNKYADYDDYIRLSVKVTNASGGCTLSSGTYKIFISPIPSAVISTSPSVCSLSQGNIAWVPFAFTGATYKWTITNGTITAGSSTRIVAYAAGTSGSVTLSVVVTNTNGCNASSGNKLVTIAGLPVATITAASSVCSRSYNNTASVTSGGTGTRYSWSISNGSINSGGNASSIIYSAGASGSVTLTVTVTNSSGCKANSGNKLVTIIALPNAAITAASSTCANSTSNAASVGTGASYSWTIIGGTITTGSGTNSIKYTAGATGYIILSATITNSNGCKATYNKWILIIGLPAGAITTSSSVCGGSPGNVASVNSAGTGATYAWGISNGTITSGGTTNSIKYTAGSSGTVTLSITVTNSTGCKATGSKNVTINAATVPVFTQVASLCLNSTAPILPTKSTNGITGTWSPSNVTTSAVATTTYTFTPAAGQCATATTMKITVKNCTTLSRTDILSNEQTISKAASVMDVVIFPNPSENYFTLVIKGNRKEIAEIRVLDVQGRGLDHFRVATGGSVQFGGNYAHGTYIVQVIQGRDQKQLKVIKL